jgi:mannose-6-phosphate isomerase-like protein (cupin superfamily)
MEMRYSLEPQSPEATETALLTPPSFEQRLLRPEADGGTRVDDARDEVLYVLEGSGRITVGAETHALAPGNAVFVARRTEWSVLEADGLLLLSVLVDDPLPAAAPHAVIAAGEHGVATAGRAFDLFAHPENGCASVTQFVGHIPPGRAPDHFHRYDEVGYILSGEGSFHVAGEESAPLSPGSCFYLPAELVHALENFGPGEMQVLGVFRPAGSPAEAYYPDGTAAAVPVDA